MVPKTIYFQTILEAAYTTLKKGKMMNIRLKKIIYRSIIYNHFRIPITIYSSRWKRRTIVKGILL